MVRDRARFAWQYLSCDSRQSACESARDCHAALLLVSLHSAQTKNTSMYFGGGLSGSYAPSDRLGSGIGWIEFPRVDPLRHSLLLAVPPLNGTGLAPL